MNATITLMAHGTQWFLYPFLFIAIYFEVFLFVTFLSSAARKRRAQKITEYTPSVAVIVPCWNEANTITNTTESLLALDYPHDKLSIILVDDGSTDETPRVMARLAHHQQITIIHKENGGKHTALNTGIKIAENSDLVGCLDADSFVEPDALREIVTCFSDPDVMAATASMSVHKPNTFIERMQYAEYLFGISVRHILSVINGLYVTPGPFSIYRMTVFKQLGVFHPAHQTEDMEMALRIQRAHMVIENAPRARVYTKTPKTLHKLIKQRTRWTSGFLRNVIYDYRDLVANPKHGALGLFVLPSALFSLLSGIGMFGMSIFLFGQRIVHTISVTSGVPLSYVITPRMHIGWFYLPINSITLLSGSIILITLTLMIIGKRISRTPGVLLPNMAIFFLLYGLISPLWIIRATADTITGTRRSWR